MATKIRQSNLDATVISGNTELAAASAAAFASAAFARAARGREHLPGGCGRTR